MMRVMDMNYDDGSGVNDDTTPEEAGERKEEKTLFSTTL
jgi:hypothetical protein